MREDAPPNEPVVYTLSHPVRSRPPHGMERPWHVTFYAPGWAWNCPGGGEVQFNKTAQHLARLGVQLHAVPRETATDGLAPLDFDTDLLHLFGTWPECLSMARRAKARGIAVVLSPISWYDPWVSWNLEPTRARKLRAVMGWTARRICSRVPSWRRELLHAADLVLPNSQAEAGQLRQLFGVDQHRIVVVPNGVDARFEHGDARLFESQFNVSDFVLVPGRIEPRKNQLTVLLALWGSGLPVVVLGDAQPEQREYFELCRREADPGVTFAGRVDHESPLLAAAYAAARVVVLASWFETPGLAALEGALAGTHVVVTERGSAREYFADLASYVRPNDPAGIRAAVRRAFQCRPLASLRETVRNSFMWDNVARATLAAYNRIALDRRMPHTETDTLARAA